MWNDWNRKQVTYRFIWMRLLLAAFYVGDGRGSISSSILWPTVHKQCLVSVLGTNRRVLRSRTPSSPVRGILASTCAALASQSTASSVADAQTSHWQMQLLVWIFLPLILNNCTWTIVLVITRQKMHLISEETVGFAEDHGENTRHKCRFLWLM